MKKLVLCIQCVGIYIISFGASIVEIKSPAAAIVIFPTFEKIKKKMSLIGFETFGTRKMNFFERIALKGMFMKQRKGIAKNGGLKGTKPGKFFTRVCKGEANRFHLGGFILGLLLGPVGVLISYFIKDDHKRKRIRWSWIGFSAWAVIIIFLAFYQRPIP